MNRQTKIVLAAMVWALAVFLFSLFLAHEATARAFTDAECGGIAHAAKEFAEARDAGAPLATSVLAVEAGIKDSRTQPTTFIKTLEDEDMMRALLALVYNNPSVSPENFRSLIKQNCIRHLVIAQK